uniref:Mitochondrial carrier protein n=1 Tax=Polytomella parva TaxID=51329 RepID=A0A7S0UU78_9CHLO|mmetsp:Transcript_17986/g.32844  ORF Transcript_17986/g.32844 Transcript_17986/m.32844 type:complete len:479 (+) Transcript_17986:70-1506(+)
MVEEANKQGVIPGHATSLAVQISRTTNTSIHRTQRASKNILHGSLDTVASTSAANISTNVLSSTNYGKSGSNISCSKPVSMPNQSARVTKVALKPASDVLAGALARAASQTTIHPLDTFKVRLQARSATSASNIAFSSPTSGLSKFGQLVPPSNGLIPHFDGIAALQGLGSLYKGIVGAASGAGIAIGAYFAFYGFSCNALSRHTELQPTQIAFVSGGVAALGSSLVKVPLAVCIRSVQAGVYPNVFAAAKSIVAKAGPRGLFTGFAPTVLEDVPDMAIKFAAYEGMREVHRRALRGRKPNPQEDFAMGAVAGALAAAATTPLDVIKTNMMCNAAARPTMMQATRAVLAEGGMGALFRGVGARALSNGINSAVFFCFFEAIKGVLASPQVQKLLNSTSPSAFISQSLKIAIFPTKKEGNEGQGSKKMRPALAVITTRTVPLRLSYRGGEGEERRDWEDKRRLMVAKKSLIQMKLITHV